MADTIREQIISAVMTRLEEWSVANGFNYDCGTSIVRAIQQIEDTALPACVLWPQAEEVEERYGQNICIMVLKVEALADIGENNRSVVQEKLLGDLIRIMTDPTVSITDLVEEIAYTSGDPAGAEQNEDKITAVAAEFRVKYSTMLGNPYSQY